MTPQQRERLLAAVAATTGTEPLSRVCAAAAVVTSTSRARISVISEGDGTAFAVAGGGADTDRLQFELGEGPSVDAHALGRAVLAPELANSSKWPAFVRAAGPVGVAAAFAFPMRSSIIRVGVLTLYRDNIAGPLADRQTTDGHDMAALALEAVLGVHMVGVLGGHLGILTEGGTHDWVVHQASGMVAGTLSVGVIEAAVRIRAHAWAEGRPVVEVAAAIVARELKLES